jgi:hypothetical protein
MPARGLVPGCDTKFWSSVGPVSIIYACHWLISTSMHKIVKILEQWYFLIILFAPLFTFPSLSLTNSLNLQHFIFIRPSLDGTYFHDYGIVLSVCLSGPCRQDRDWNVSSRIIQLGILDHHHERKNPIVFQGQRLKVKVVALLGRKTL